MSIVDVDLKSRTFEVEQLICCEDHLPCIDFDSQVSFVEIPKRKINLNL